MENRTATLARGKRSPDGAQRDPATCVDARKRRPVVSLALNPSCVNLKTPPIRLHMLVLYCFDFFSPPLVGTLLRGAGDAV
jgi:hypothetical protein